MDNSSGKFWSDMPMWAKGVTRTIIVVGFAFAGWITYKFIKKMGESRDDNDAIRDSSSALNQLQHSGITPSYNPSQYSSWALIFKEAMDGCGDGAINTIPIFKNMRNDADIHSLIKAYGVKTVDKCGIGNGDFTGNLPATLAYKYSGVESTLPFGLGGINSILQKNGLTFRF